MDWFNTLKNRINYTGNNLRDQTIEISKYSYIQDSKDDPSNRLIKRYRGNRLVNEFSGNIIDESSQTKKAGQKKLVCLVDYEVNIGDYIVFENNSNSMKHWLVTYVEDNSITKLATISQCNYLLKGINKETLKIFEFPAVLIHKNSYSSGIWSNTFAQYVDGEIACVLPLIDDIKLIKRDDRFLISQNELHPESFRVTKLQTALQKGLLQAGFKEDEPCPVYDDYENMIADRWKYENSYQIVIKNGDSISVGLEQNTKILVEVEAFNELRKVKSIVTSPTLTYKVANENTLKILEDGTVVPLSVGCTCIDILLKSNSTEKADIITQKRIEVNVTESIHMNNMLVINGNSTIFFDTTATYTFTLFKNGFEVDDAFKFRIVTNIDTPVSSNVALLKNVGNKSCDIQVFSINSTIKLVAKSELTGAENVKLINIRDIQ